MRIDEIHLRNLRVYAQHKHGKGCRILLTAGWGCTIFEVFRRGEEYPAERIIW